MSDKKQGKKSMIYVCQSGPTNGPRCLKRVDLKRGSNFCPGCGTFYHTMHDKPEAITGYVGHIVCPAKAAAGEATT